MQDTQKNRAKEAIRILEVLVRANKDEIHRTPISQFRIYARSEVCDVRRGICANLRATVSGSFLLNCFESWEHFSGCKVYPVPAPCNKGSRSAAIMYYGEVDNYYSGEYGKLRRDLAQHIISCIKTEYKDLLEDQDEH